MIEAPIDLAINRHLIPAFGRMEVTITKYGAPPSTFYVLWCADHGELLNNGGPPECKNPLAENLNKLQTWNNPISFSVDCDSSILLGMKGHRFFFNEKQPKEMAELEELKAHYLEQPDGQALWKHNMDALSYQLLESLTVTIRDVENINEGWAWASMPWIDDPSDPPRITRDPNEIREMLEMFNQPK